MTVGTLRQYEQAHRARTLANNPGLTGSDYDRCYPAGCRERQWIVAVEEYVRDGGAITRVVADDLYKRGTDPVRFLRHWPHALPDGYMTPDVREANRKHEREMVDARNRGRSAMR